MYRPLSKRAIQEGHAAALEIKEEVETKLAAEAAERRRKELSRLWFWGKILLVFIVLDVVFVICFL